MPQPPRERTATEGDPVVGIDALADADEPGTLAQGSDVHDVDALERQLGATSDLDELLLAYLRDAEPMPDVPVVEVADPRRDHPRRG